MAIDTPALAARLREARKAQKRTQAFVAQSIGVTQGLLSRVEDGDFQAISQDNLKKLCSFLGVSLDLPTKEMAGPKYCFTSGCYQNNIFVDPQDKLRFMPIAIRAQGASPKFCPGCGQGLHAACPHCQSPLPQAGAFCMGCGQALIKVPESLANHPEPQEYVAMYQLQRQAMLTDSPFNAPLPVTPE